MHWTTLKGPTSKTTCLEAPSHLSPSAWETSQNPSLHTGDDTTDTPNMESRGSTSEAFLSQLQLHNGGSNTKFIAGQDLDALASKETRPLDFSSQIDLSYSDLKVGGSKTLVQVNKERAEHVQALEEKVKNAKVLLLQKQAAEQEALEDKVRKAKALLLQRRNFSKTERQARNSPSNARS